MNFWELVDYELEYQGMDRKKLASEVGFDVSNISKGIKNGNVPSADTALLIAKKLNVSLEYLLTGNVSQSKDSADKALNLFFKYRKTISSFESMNEETREAILEMIYKIGKKA